MTEGSPARQRYSTGGPYETTFGYSRALRTGDRILVSGCTSVTDGEVQHRGDAGAQALVAMDSAIEAIRALGGDPRDVVRTRLYVVDRADCEAVGRAHGQRFSAAGPAATMVIVAGLIDAAMLVEVELEARVGTSRPPHPRDVRG